jgi:hypothetical protein
MYACARDLRTLSDGSEFLSGNELLLRLSLREGV